MASSPRTGHGVAWPNRRGRMRLPEAVALTHRLSRSLPITRGAGLEVSYRARADGMGIALLRVKRCLTESCPHPE
jgi:hypothetical protein